MRHTHGSPYKRLRMLSTLGLCAAGFLALMLMASGHTMHGALTGLAGLSLLPTSHLGRRARRRAALQADAWAEASRHPAKARRAA
jgi:hypothetical protein